METSIPKKRMTFPEFMEWQSEADGRWELHDGLPVQMHAERVRHALAKRGVERALDGAVRDAGLPCTVLPDGITVEIENGWGFIPDVSVQCGPVDLDKTTNEEPVIVVEVVSPGSRRTDEKRKLDRYFLNPKVMHYLIVYPEDRTVTHFRRAGDKVETSIGTQRMLTFDPPGFEVDSQTFFADLPADQ